ncbi:MAG: DUF5666 domain-containing protein [Acidimicrobiales bacterium]
MRATAAGAVCVALAFGTAGVALAGSRSHDRGHSSIAPRDNGQQWNGASGVVSALGTNSITVKDRHGTTTTYTTTGTTTYFEGKTAGVVGDLAVGERVNLNLTSTSPQTVTKVTIFLDHFVGTVTGVSGSVITITGFHNTTLTVDVSGTTTYTSGGAASSLAAVVNGVIISAIGLPGSSADSLNATSVNIFTPPVQTYATGVVSALGTNSITLKGRHGTTTTYTTTGTTTYFEGKTAGVVGDLAVGERVNLDLTSTSPQTVTKVTICLERVSGSVTGVSGNTITITSHTATVMVDVSGTTTYTSGGAASSFAAVVSGVEISGVGLPGSSAGTFNANSVNIFTPPVQTHASGVVSALGTNSITLKGRRGTTTYTTTGTTTYFEGKTAGVVGDLAVGERVSLDLTSTSPQTVTKVTIALDVVIGKVTGVSGNVITITGFHNTTLTVDVSGTTTYTSAGAASSLTAVVAGVVIVAVGLPGSSAGSLNATTVNIGAGFGHGPIGPIGGPVHTWGASQGHGKSSRH